MDIKKFPDPKLNLPKELKTPTEKHRMVSFRAIENYLTIVKEYIYTDINLDYEINDPLHIHAWVQKIVSQNIIRSLYLRNAFVELFNARNTVGIYLPLKAWFETVGALASILSLLENNLTPEQLFNKLEPFALGNRGKSNHRIGTVDAISVSAMIENANKYINKIYKEHSIDKDSNGLDKFFSDFYDTASNPTHPSFDAHEIIGGVDNNLRTWRGKYPDEIRSGIIKDLDGYGGLLMSPFFVNSICKKIFEIEKEHFSKLNSRKYFDK